MGSRLWLACKLSKSLVPVKWWLRRWQGPTAALAGPTGLAVNMFVIRRGEGGVCLTESSWAPPLVWSTLVFQLEITLMYFDWRMHFTFEGFLWRILSWLLPLIEGDVVGFLRNWWLGLQTALLFCVVKRPQLASHQWRYGCRTEGDVAPLTGYSPYARL